MPVDFLSVSLEISEVEAESILSKAIAIVSGVSVGEAPADDTKVPAVEETSAEAEEPTSDAEDSDAEGEPVAAKE